MTSRRELAEQQPNILPGKDMRVRYETQKITPTFNSDRAIRRWLVNLRSTEDFRINISHRYE